MPSSRSRRPAPPRPQVRSAAPGLRGAVERRSAPVLTWLTTRNRLILPLVSLALLIGGLVLPVALAVPMLLLLIAIVGWLTYLSWPVTQGGGRVLRAATLGLLALAVVLAATGG